MNWAEALLGRTFANRSLELHETGISALKFEAGRIHFSIDVFVAVAVVVAYAPRLQNSRFFSQNQ